MVWTKDRGRRMTNKEAIEFLKNMIDREAIGFVCPEREGDVAIWQYHVEALQMAISALKIQDKLLDILKGFGSELPCDESPDNDWCAEHCEYTEPQNECWIRWAKGALGLPLEEGVQKE